MKKILKYIWDFINSKFFGYTLAILAVVILAGQCQRNNDLKRENLIHEQNIAAADTTISELKNKVGDYEAQKAVWITTEKELKKQNRELYDKIKDQNGDIISLNNVVLSLKQDTTILHDSIRFLTSQIDSAVQVTDSTWRLPWRLQYQWDLKNFDFFRGHTLVKVDTIDNSVTHLNTVMDSRYSQIDLTFGEKVVDGQYNVYVTSSYPGLTASSLEGVMIDPNENKYIQQLIEKKHWFTGWSVTVGITPTWDFIEKRPTIVIGPTFGYTIYQW